MVTLSFFLMCCECWQLLQTNLRRYTRWNQYAIASLNCTVYRMDCDGRMSQENKRHYIPWNRISDVECVITTSWCYVWTNLWKTTPILWVQNRSFRQELKIFYHHLVKPLIDYTFYSNSLEKSELKSEYYLSWITCDLFYYDKYVKSTIILNCLLFFFCFLSIMHWWYHH